MAPNPSSGHSLRSTPLGARPSRRRVTGATSGHGQRWYEVTDYLNGPLRSMLSSNNVINADVWNDIPADLQQIFIEEGAKAELEQLRLTSIQNIIGVQRNIDAGMTLVEFSPELRDHSFDVAVIEHVIPGWLNWLHYPGAGDNAVAMFNEHVGPYVGLRIESGGSVAQVPISQGPHARTQWSKCLPSRRGINGRGGPPPPSAGVITLLARRRRRPGVRLRQRRESPHLRGRGGPAPSPAGAQTSVVRLRRQPMPGSVWLNLNGAPLLWRESSGSASGQCGV